MSAYIRVLIRHLTNKSISLHRLKHKNKHKSKQENKKPPRSNGKNWYCTEVSDVPLRLAYTKPIRAGHARNLQRTIYNAGFQEETDVKNKWDRAQRVPKIARKPKKAMKSGGLWWVGWQKPAPREKDRRHVKRIGAKFRRRRRGSVGQTGKKWQVSQRTYPRERG